MRNVVHNKGIFSIEIAANFDLKNNNKTISPSYIRRICIDNDLKAYKIIKKPLITKKTSKKRLEFCRKYQDIDWQNVIFSDECRIMCFATNHMPLIRRPRGSALDPRFISPTVKYPTSVMIWGCFRNDTLGPLKIISGTMNSEKYIGVLDEKLIPFYQSHANSIFQDDSVPCHRSKKVNHWKNEKGIDCLEWPSCSPDLNPIEHIWAYLKKKVAKKAPYNQRSLIEAILKVWRDEIPREYLLALSSSMKNRINECIINNGYNTKY